MSYIYGAPPSGVPVSSKISTIAGEVPIHPVVTDQGVSRASSNLSLILDGVGFTLFCVGLMASSWIGCALSDVCTAANGGPF